MPIYEYECKKCGHRFETIQKISDAPLKKCEKCSGRAERLISSPAIQFKGSGWYVTDYARKGSPTEARDSSKKDAKADSTSDSKKDSKKDKPTSKAAAK